MKEIFQPQEAHKVQSPGPVKDRHGVCAGYLTLILCRVEVHLAAVTQSRWLDAVTSLGSEAPEMLIPWVIDLESY